MSSNVDLSELVKAINNQTRILSMALIKAETGRNMNETAKLVYDIEKTSDFETHVPSAAFPNGKGKISIFLILLFSWLLF